MLCRTWSCESNKLPQPRPGPDVYVVVWLLCLVLGEARGVCTRRQRDSGVGDTRSRDVRQSLPESNDCYHKGGLKGGNEDIDGEKLPMLRVDATFTSCRFSSNGKQTRAICRAKTQPFGNNRQQQCSCNEVTVLADGTFLPRITPAQSSTLALLI